MNVIVTVRRGKESTYMKTFTIDNDHNISAFASQKEAAAASTTPFDLFASHSELAELAAAWPATHLVEIWNSIPGVHAVTKFTNRKIATERIWKAIQSLGGAVAQKPTTEASESVVTEVAPTKPEPAIVPQANQEVAIAAVDGQTATEQPVANVGAQAAAVTPVALDTAAQPPSKKKAAKTPQKAEAPKAASVREGSKTARVVAMLQRKDGASLPEIMQKMGWQKHTVRGFMAGAMKKAGHTVESFKPEGGARTYRITK